MQSERTEVRRKRGGGGEAVLLCPIHNGFIFDHLAKHNNTATAKMLFDLPLSRHDVRKALTKSVSELRAKRRDLMKRKSKSTEDANIFGDFSMLSLFFQSPRQLKGFDKIFCGKRPKKQ